MTGIAYGSLLAIFSALTYDYFGMKNAGINYGWVFSSFAVAGVVGPLTAGHIVDLTKSYNGAYLFVAALLAVSAIMVQFLKPPGETKDISIS